MFCHGYIRVNPIRLSGLAAFMTRIFFPSHRESRGPGWQACAEPFGKFLSDFANIPDFTDSESTGLNF
jgi:hypothetical protein